VHVCLVRILIVVIVNMLIWLVSVFHSVNIIFIILISGYLKGKMFYVMCIIMWKLYLSLDKWCRYFVVL
jgi:hypothetical protein